MAVKKQKTVAEIRNELLPEREVVPGLTARGNNIPIEEARKKKFKKPPKAKRSYMLREDTIQHLEDCKRIYKGKSLSEVLTIAIEEFYERRKAEIQNTFTTD